METLRNEQFLRLLTTYPRGERTFVVAAGVEDEVESEWLIKAGIGQEYKPDDYLRLFEIFIEEHSEEIRAVSILLSKPSDWGVGPLRELREALLQAPEHFTESNLQKAFNATHHKALVDIISMVKRAADDETPLMTAEERAQAVEDRLDSTTDTTMERADEASDVDADLETDTGAEFDTPAADAEVDVETDAELDTQPER